ncbi:uncharacterized protein LOC126823658 [Patella vulgata]|uniref:uncharacterized protein LOC126823658 n=1 Tax=Patella vulgata TaxID=6465 RepID=UPI00217FCF14|nr:uncharacterized protein LOC126823658 [Patella vulgata]
MVAIKAIQKKIVPQEFLTKFVPRELENHTALPRHENVVRIFEHFSTPDFTYVVMEYMSKGDLLDLINQNISRSERGLGDELSKRFFKQICLGLHHIHGHGVVHRDMKCENILVSENFDVKITDFGFSCQYMDRSILLKTSCGSYAYTSPEVIKNKPYDGICADIWSIGIILCAMINGRLPYNDGQLTEMDDDMRMQRLRFERNVSFDCMVLVRKLLQYRPMLRPALSEILKDPWITGKKPIPRQLNKPKWTNAYFVNKSNEDGKDSNKLRVDGSNPGNAPLTSPLYYRTGTPERTRTTTSGIKDAVVLSRGARETIILKSRCQANGYNEINQKTERRPKTWPKSVKEQADKIKAELRSTSADKRNHERIKQLMAVTNKRVRARTSTQNTKTSGTYMYKDIYTPLMYMYKFLQANGNVETSPINTQNIRQTKTVTYTPPLPVNSYSPNENKVTAPANSTQQTVFDSYSKQKTPITNTKDTSDAFLNIGQFMEIPDRFFYELDTVEESKENPEEVRSGSVPARNRITQDKKPQKQTPEERAQTCRDRILHAYGQRATATPKEREIPFLPLMVQKIDLSTTEGTKSPEAVQTFQAPCRLQLGTRTPSTDKNKRRVKAVYKYKYH